MTVITSFKIYPNFYAGFEYTWEINTTLADRYPWKFVVEQSDTPYDKFIPASPELTNVYRYREDKRRMVSKDNVLHFRLKMTTPAGVYYSDVIDPHWQLSKPDFLIARRMMHDEYLGQRNHVGVLVDVWIRCFFGPVCTCVDPITKDVLKQSCPLCYGTGRQPGYHGPYTTWCTYSPVKKQKGLQDDNTGPISNYSISGRLTAVPELKKEDIIIDKASGRYYYVDDVSNDVEIRRTPIVQTAVLKQVPTSSPVYRLGND